MKKIGYCFVMMVAASFPQFLQAEDVFWTYTETSVNTKGIGIGYITDSDGIWKLYANRLAKDSSQLYVSASGGEFKGDSAKVYPINLTDIYNEDKSEKYTVNKFGRFSHRRENNFLYNYKGCLSEFIAPECTILEGGNNDGYNFNGCTSLTNVVLNGNLTEFPAAAFSGCSALVDIAPRSFDACTKVYGSAFSGCKKLRGKIYLSSSTLINDSAFSGCALIEEVSAPAATYIGAYAFLNCTALSKIEVSPNLSQVGQEAFRECVNLAPDTLDKILGKSLLHFGSSSDMNKKGREFYHCSSLSSLEWDFPNLATNIVNQYCFWGCSSLEKVVFKTPVVEIRYGAFYNMKPGGEIYLHNYVPAVIEREALSRNKDNPPYTKVYLSDNVDGWLEVLGKYHHVIPKDKFDDRTFYAEAPLMTCGRTADHLKMSWQTMVNMMAKDTAVCESVKSGSNVTSVKMKERGVIAFVLCHNYNHGESCFWVMRAPKRGFSVIIR